MFGVVQKSFKSRDVGKSLIAGRSWGVHVAYVSCEDFETHFEVAPGPGHANMHRTTALTLRGDKYAAVAMRPDDIPEGLPFFSGQSVHQGGDDFG